MQVVALHADATYTVHFGDGTNLTGVREACFAAAPAAAKASTVDLKKHDEARAPVPGLVILNPRG